MPESVETAAYSEIIPSLRPNADPPTTRPRLRRAVTQKLLDVWDKGVNQAHFRELVIGPAPDSGTPGPWVELSPWLSIGSKG
jgi:hypothetical protein